MNAEIVVNLWAIFDAGTGLIYALSGRAYLASGTKNEKLALLQRRAATDHVTAKRYEVPDRFEVRFTDGTVLRKVTLLDAVTDPNAELFEEMFRNIESQLSMISDLSMRGTVPQKLPMNPLCVATVLYENDAGDVRPIITDDDRRWIAAQQQTYGRRTFRT